MINCTRKFKGDKYVERYVVHLPSVFQVLAPYLLIQQLEDLRDVQQKSNIKHSLLEKPQLNSLDFLFGATNDCEASLVVFKIFFRLQARRGDRAFKNSSIRE